MDLKELKLTPKRTLICEKLGLNNSYDILSYYPYKYDELIKTQYSNFNIGDNVCFEGELINYPSTFRYGKRSTTRFKVLYDDEEISVTIFNRPWIRNIDINEKITIIGKYDGNNKVTATNYYAKAIDEVVGIVPQYALKEGISQNEIKKLIEYTYKKSLNELEDDIPNKYKESHKLISYKEAITNIHFPSNKDDLKKALSRLKYEEFLRFYLALDILKGNNELNIKEKKIFDENKINELINNLGYELTNDQIKSIDDILNDLRSNKIMYRLLQGEVGSGKTIVSLIGLYANYLAGYQGALMAPTEILAKQHYESFKKILEPLGVKIGVLYSNQDNEKEIKNKLKNNEIDIVVGTHALFSDDVIFNKLGFVIADEQQRFGVKQRKKFKEKGENADFLLMSATPIPRTLASSIYGDMDISTIETLPLNRKGCKTYLIKKNSIVDILPEIKKKLDEGRQIYIIAAAIEKSDNYKAKDVYGLYESLIDVLNPYNVSLLHGRLSSLEKDEVMERFNNNEIQVLISTTVVEVGVNVKNATVMIIYDSDKFGLSQLHQLRGRIQRGEHEGTCYLLTDNKDKEVINRLEVLVNNNDGFKISYEDLKLRGPGDILGTRQSGLPTFILGNLLEDTRFINAAREDAKEISENLHENENKIYYEKIKELASKNYID